MGKETRYFIILILMSALLSGCVPFVQSIRQTLFPTPEERFVTKSLQRGKALQERGEMAAALEQYKLALTVNPSNSEAMENRKQLQKEIRSEAKRHYEAGLKLHKKGKHDRARQEFLIALRLRPDYPQAVKILTSRKRIPIRKYTVHRIMKGESLSKLAKMYYGDYYKYPIIAKYNDIIDESSVQVGQEVRIPEIEGIKFQVAKQTIETEKIEVAYSGFWDWEDYASEFHPEEPSSARSEERDEEPADQIAIYRDYGIDLFNQKKYDEAIVAFNEVLKADPQDEPVLAYAHRSHFEKALAHFEEKDYLAAKGEFEAALRHKQDCEACNEHIRKSEDLYKETHYKKGIEYFGNERLNDAIEEWELVWAVDPSYKRVEYLIQKAKTILKNIEKLKDSLNEQVGYSGN